MKDTKKIIAGICVIILVILVGYFVYTLYQYAVEDATKRIRQGVTQGVEEGMSKGVGDALNPLKLPFRMFGGK